MNCLKTRLFEPGFLSKPIQLFGIHNQSCGFAFEHDGLIVMLGYQPFVYQPLST